MACFDKAAKTNTIASSMKMMKRFISFLSNAR
jgi:hypothetical protein